jgi:hypothetical protein
MRKTPFFVMLLALCASARAQDAIGYVMPQVDEKFWIQVNWICPPPGEPAPPGHCNLSSVATNVQMSDAKAQGPAQATVRRNQAVMVGPFRFKATGVNWVKLVAADGSGDVVAISGFDVQPRR